MKKILLAFSLALTHLSLLNAQADRRVILVIIDGARYSETLGDPSARYVPRIRSLAQQGVVLDSMLNDDITVTARAIPAIWSGSWAAPHDTIVNGAANQYATAPTVWEYFRKSRGVDSTHALYIMKLLSTPWIQSIHPQYGPAYWPWYVLQGSSDLDVWQNAKAKLQAHHPELAVIYFPDVDSAPSRGWSAYTQAIVTADSIVGMLWNFLQGDPFYRNTTTLLVTNDHGRHLDGVQNGFVSHGDGCWGCRHIMFLGVGAGMPKGMHSSVRRTITDITPTIGSLLGFPTPYATGKSMAEILTSVEAGSRDESLPRTVQLGQNFPNPFNPSTVLSFRLSAVSFASLRVFNVLGEEVATLVNEVRPAGTHTVQWNANSLPSGIYFYRLQAGTCTDTKKMTLLR
ncbi:MAG: T9SS type A sorting domain-containing protein [Ignavibacteriales bacterium]|nr:T9SS type A sorting domain-containing protein [Ignavibacteriales bacterium]